jgi:chromosome segregation ATPase/SAM-dependent methyltransferase
MPSSAPSPSRVLVSLAEPLVRGRRVALLGNVLSGLAQELAERGARVAHGYDPDPGRAAEAATREAARAERNHKVVLGALGPDLGVRDGAFDVVIVPDLTLFREPLAELARARRLLAAGGVAIVASPNGEISRSLLPRAAAESAPASYYELFDMLMLQWEQVRMLGQAPFVGYALVDFAPEGEPEVTVDTSLLASPEEPEWFVAVASDRAPSVEAFSLVELPLGEVLAGMRQPTPSDEDRLALAEARARLTLLGAELEALREKARKAERDAEQRGSEVQRLSTRLAEAQAAPPPRAPRPEPDLSKTLQDTSAELERQKERAGRLARQLEDERRDKQRMEAALRNQAPARPSEDDALRAQLAKAEAALEAAERRVGELELEVAETLRKQGAASRDEGAARVASGLELARSHERARVGEERAARAEAQAKKLEEQAKAGEERAARAEAQAKKLEEQAKAGEERAARAEAQAKKLEEQAKAGEERAARAEAQAKKLEEQAKAGEERAARAEAQAKKLEEQAKAGEERAARAEAQATGKVHALRERASEAEARVVELEEEVDNVLAQVAELETRLAEREARVAQLEGASGVPEAEVTSELARLEAQLAERGRTIAQLGLDLREAERIGRELLRDVEALRAHGVAPLAVERAELVARLDKLAEEAARREADAQAARWRIAQLERELATQRALHASVTQETVTLLEQSAQASS